MRLSRREFLRLSALTTAGSVAAACDVAPPPAQTTEPASEASTTSSPSVTPVPVVTAAPAPLAIAGGMADVWAWKRQIAGTIPADCTAAFLSIGEQKVDLTLDGQRFSAEAPLDAGENQIVLTCTRAGGQKERSEPLVYNVRLTRRPTATIQIAVEDDGVVLDGSASKPEEVGGAIAQYLWSFRESNPAPLDMQDVEQEGEQGTAERLVVGHPPADGEYYVTLRVVDEEGREDTSTAYFVVSGGQPRIPDYDLEHSAWVDNAIVYGVIARKFGDPAFAGLIERLDYLRDLGINALWLSPINRSPAGDYGYAVTDYFDVNPDFGTKEEFKTLVTEAHARGIRVLMDFVPNHSSSEHPYFRDAQARGAASPYYSFYDRDRGGNPTHYFDWEHLPNLNYDNPEVQRWMIEAFSYWIRDFDVDGFRVDVAWGVTERKPEFWPTWRRELKRIKPDLMLLAEAGARDEYYFENGYDVAYDWTAQVGKWAWEIAWESSTLTVYNLNAALTNNGNGFHPDARVFHFLNNNDTGTRFITEHGEEMTRVATALLLTVPGVPCVYTGDEIGAWFRPYFDENPLVWEEDKYPGLLDYHKKLIALRKDIPSLRSQDWQPLEAEPNDRVYSYLRYMQGGDQPVLVVLNFSEEEMEATIPLPEDFAGLLEQATWQDMLRDETVTVSQGEALGIPLPAWGVRIMMAAG